MREKSLLSATIIIIGATLLLISYKRPCAEVTTVSAYEREPLLQEEVYYTTVEPVEPHYIVTEREIAGIIVSEIDYKKVKKYKYSFTDEEIEILERIVEAECTGQSKESRMNVASVIINRVKSDDFPDNIKDVVFERHQFSPTEDGRYYEVDVTKDTIKAISEVLHNGVTTDALFFCNISDVKSLSNQQWFQNLDYLFKDDSGHSFYK